MAASLTGFSEFGDFSIPSRRDRRRGDVKSEDCGRSGWMVDGWPISEASSAAMRDSAAAREDGEGSGSISEGERQFPFPPIALNFLKPGHGVCSWAWKKAHMGGSRKTRR